MKRVQHVEKNVTSPKPIIGQAPQKPQYKDTCVNCGVETPYTKDTPIDYRNYYVEGAGQLCKECYFDIYEKRAK